MNLLQWPPVDADDNLRPGSLYFAHLKPDEPPCPKTCWIVLVVSEDLCPQSMIDSKPNASRYPCWVMGRNKFIWIRRECLHYLCDDQGKVFDSKPDEHATFSNFYALARGAAQEDPLSYFQGHIYAASRNMSESARRKRVRGTPDGSSSRDRPGRGLFCQDARSRSPNPDTVLSTDDDRRKRFQLCAGFFTPSPPQSTESTVAEMRPQIKTEEEQERLKPLTHLQPEEQVLVYFGRKIEERLMALSDLDKSSVLKSWVLKDDGLLHIMNPKLLNVDPELFKVVLEFIQTSEYVPCIVERSQATEEDAAPLVKALDGLRTVEDYSEELVRAGRLYLLAEKFKVHGLSELIYTKITEAHLQDYTHESLLRFARLLFARPKAGSAQGNSSASLLENWTISTLVKDFWTIMQNHCSLLQKVAAASRCRHRAKTIHTTTAQSKSRSRGQDRRASRGSNS